MKKTLKKKKKNQTKKVNFDSVCLLLISLRDDFNGEYESEEEYENAWLAWTILDHVIMHILEITLEENTGRIWRMYGWASDDRNNPDEDDGGLWQEDVPPNWRGFDTAILED